VYTDVVGWVGELEREGTKKGMGARGGSTGGRVLRGEKIMGRVRRKGCKKR